MFQDRVIHLGKIRRSGKVSFTEKSKIVDRGSICSALESTVSKLQYEPFSLSVRRLGDEGRHLEKNLGDQGKGRSPIKLKSFIDVLYVATMKVPVLIFNMNVFSSPQRVPRPSYPFREKIGKLRKIIFTEKAKIIDRGYRSCPLESTGCKLQHEPYLFSVACS